MSTTFYDSPEDTPGPRLSIDVTHDYCWFFEHGGDDAGLPPAARARKEELPAICAAMAEFLAPWSEVPVPLVILDGPEAVRIDAGGPEGQLILDRSQALQLAARLVRAAAGAINV
jgi:hypothetical protein